MFMFMLVGRPSREGGPCDPPNESLLDDECGSRALTPPRQRRIVGILSVFRHVSMTSRGSYDKNENPRCPIYTLSEPII